MAITQECCVQSWTNPGGNTPQDTNCTATCPITKTIQVRWTRHAGHCWRSRDELVRDVLLWTPTHGRAKAGRPGQHPISSYSCWMYVHAEDLPRVMNDREEWRERVRDIRATSATWWWWLIWLIYCWDKRNGSHLEHILLKMYSLSKRHQCFLLFFFNGYYITFQDMQYFSKLLDSYANH